VSPARGMGPLFAVSLGPGLPGSRAVGCWLLTVGCSSIWARRRRSARTRGARTHRRSRRARRRPWRRARRVAAAMGLGRGPGWRATGRTPTATPEAAHTSAYGSEVRFIDRKESLQSVAVIVVLGGGVDPLKIEPDAISQRYWSLPVDQLGSVRRRATGFASRPSQGHPPPGCVRGNRPTLGVPVERLAV
jgi:hypothetical protein